MKPYLQQEEKSLNPKTWGQLWIFKRLTKASFLSVLLRGVVDDFAWACTDVYGPNDDGKEVCFVGGVVKGTC